MTTFSKFIKTGTPGLPGRRVPWYYEAKGKIIMLWEEDYGQFFTVPGLPNKFTSQDDAEIALYDLLTLLEDK